MEPVRTPQMFHTFVKEGCFDVPAWYGPNADGAPVVITAWKFTPEEIEKLKAGEPMYLHIGGISMPPVYLEVENPFT